MFLGAQIRFENPDLNRRGELLFTAKVENSPRYGSYTALFQAALESSGEGTAGAITQLSFFPEQILVLGSGLQIQNPFGVFRTNSQFSGMEVLERFPAFVRGDEITLGKTLAMSASPSGAYLCFLRSSGSGYADLILTDLNGGAEQRISRNLEIRYEAEGLPWSPDSEFFLYSKDEKLYYFSLRQFRENRVLPEEYRCLGAGGTVNARWTEEGTLVFIDGDLVHLITGSELFTRSLYNTLLDTGILAGRLPFRFDPNFDRFWVSPGEEAILLNKGGQNIFIHYFNNPGPSPDLPRPGFSPGPGNPLNAAGGIVALPYFYLPRNTRIKTLLWTSRDRITLLTVSYAEGVEQNRLYRLNLSASQGGSQSGFLSEVTEPGLTAIALSPDGRRLALSSGDRIRIRDYETWNFIQEYYHPEPLHLGWVDGSRLIAAGRWYTEMIDTLQNQSRLLSLSQAAAPGWDGGTQLPVCSGRAYDSAGNRGDVFYEYDAASLAWRRRSAVNPAPSGLVSPRFRVYLEPIGDRAYANQIMVRRVNELRTDPLFPLPRSSYDPFPVEEETPQEDYFSHGSRLRRREVALIFNGMDSAAGLAEVLNVLKDYGLRCTFFLNGDFIRQNPDACRDIALSGHEVGSLFSSGINLTDSRYVVDRDYIKLGLARNEDDYFSATGRELALLWHAPHYVVNSLILEASREMNYVYVGRDVDPLDWALTDPASGRLTRLSAPAMITRIMDLKKPGSIIPIQLGLNDFRSGGYLYNSLDVLINSLVHAGYSIVPVSQLMEHAL
ncbi:MAG: polysaccharide deacetylase family protein [Spirochaetales bacterium]|nr:polysaccharide deacetylase family protein [Spirochaetales bacterium]